MIRELQKADIDRVAGIWLDANLKAHDFISAQYWENNFELLKEMRRRQKPMYMRRTGEYRALSA